MGREQLGNRGFGKSPVRVLNMRPNNNKYAVTWSFLLVLWKLSRAEIAYYGGHPTLCIFFHSVDLQPLNASCWVNQDFFGQVRISRGGKFTEG